MNRARNLLQLGYDISVEIAATEQRVIPEPFKV